MIHGPAIPTERTRYTTRGVVTPVSRYHNAPIQLYGRRRVLCYETYLRKPYQPTGLERMAVVKAGWEYRPDLLAFDVYGSGEQWWRILEANGMADVFDFKVGTTVLLPDFG